MDAFLGETDDKGRMPSYGKVAIAAVVGNEDGAHHVAAEVLQALLEVGFSAPPGGVPYWVGEAMGFGQLHRSQDHAQGGRRLDADAGVEFRALGASAR